MTKKYGRNDSGGRVEVTNEVVGDTGFWSLDAGQKIGIIRNPESGIQYRPMTSNIV